MHSLGIQKSSFNQSKSSESRGGGRGVKDINLGRYSTNNWGNIGENWGDVIHGIFLIQTIFF